MAVMVSETGRSGGRKGHGQDVLYVRITMFKKET